MSIPTTTDPPTTSTSTLTSTPTPTRPPPLRGLNHLKLPVSSIPTTVTFYTTILPFTPLPQYNHYTPTHHLFGAMFIHEASNLLIEARYNPSQALAQKGWDPITFGIGTREDLETWAKWLDHKGVGHSRVLVGVKGWVMGVEDPDGRVVRLYVEEEEHEWTDEPDVDEVWLGRVVGGSVGGWWVRT